MREGGGRKRGQKEGRKGTLERERKEARWEEGN